VQTLESGGVPLAESMALWERGEELAAICQTWLDGARAKIDAARARDAEAAD
ncbi:MAG TPA: exodeoxyribonuclease VII small subunit, partial [Propionibacteriaceae bacterium]|nr:exodeoxyribonuclease VII small subunit [Propionibacteriaceae bacterium]